MADHVGEVQPLNNNDETNNIRRQTLQRQERIRFYVETARWLCRDLFFPLFYCLCFYYFISIKYPSVCKSMAENYDYSVNRQHEAQQIIPRVVLNPMFSNHSSSFIVDLVCGTKEVVPVFSTEYQHKFDSYDVTSVDGVCLLKIYSYVY